MSALVEKMCHFGEMPWHGESEALTGTESANEVMVKAGQTLHGSLNYMPLIDAYNLTQRVVETGAISSQIVRCQNGKKYTSADACSGSRPAPGCCT